MFFITSDTRIHVRLSSGFCGKHGTRDFSRDKQQTRALSQNVTNAHEGALTPNLNNDKVSVQNKLQYCKKISGQNSSMKINKEP